MYNKISILTPAKTIFTLFALLLSISVYAGDKLKPFILASNAPGDMAAVAADTKTKLTSAGFKIVGEYSPYDGANIIIVTNDTLKKNAAATDAGGYGAVQRISITDKDGSIQVAYTNPTYMAYAYQLKGDLKEVTEALEKALGKQQAFGSKKGLDEDDLKGYHYMFGMPYFDEPDVVAEHGSYDAAIKAVEAGLAAGKGGVSKVYRVDIPGKQQTVFGVAMTDGMSSDATIMKEVDFMDIRSTAHLPYEVLVDRDGKVYALSAKFRIAINFPDLSMAGAHSFMGIMASPDAIKEALAQAAGAARKKSGGGAFDF